MDPKSSGTNWMERSHRRLNRLTGEWVQVSPERAKRPWQGKEEVTPTDARPSYDPKCYLCPGNKRAGGHRNPDYGSVFVFDNDFSALTPKPASGTEDNNPSAAKKAAANKAAAKRREAAAKKTGAENKPTEAETSTYRPEADQTDAELLTARPEHGICRVICFSPRHDLTLPDLSHKALVELVEVWTDQYRELGSLLWINYVQIFENKGEIMGCSNPHPHGQIWAQESIPDEPLKELVQQREYYRNHGRTLLSDYLEIELEREERIVLQNDTFVVLVPYWAFWPFETIIISRRPFGRFTDMKKPEQEGLADVLKRLTTTYDRLFNVSFPYSAGFHPAPTDGEPHPEWHFHMHFYPPLLRSAHVKKFRVGYEMLASPQRDMTAEASAGMLRNLVE